MDRIITKFKLAFATKSAGPGAIIGRALFLFGQGNLAGRLNCDFFAFYDKAILITKTRKLKSTKF